MDTVVTTIKPRDRVAYTQAYNRYLHACGLFYRMQAGGNPQHIPVQRAKVREAYAHFVKQAQVGQGYVVPKWEKRGQFTIPTPAIAMPDTVIPVNHIAWEDVEFVMVSDQPTIYNI